MKQRSITRDVRCRDADRGSVKLACKLGQHQANRLRSTGRGRDHRQSCRTCAMQVLMRQVEDALVVGVGVDRRHVALADTAKVVQHLRDRRQAVGGAGGVRNDLVIRRKLVVVHAIDDGEVRTFRRRRYQHLLRAGGEMRGGLVLVGENAGTFHHDVDAERSPGQFRGIAFVQHLDVPGADIEAVTFDPDLALERPVHGIVFQQMHIRLQIADIVDRHDAHVWYRLYSLMARSTFLPIRPKPLIPTLTVISSSSVRKRALFACTLLWRYTKSQRDENARGQAPVRAAVSRILSGQLARCGRSATNSSGCSRSGRQPYAKAKVAAPIAPRHVEARAQRFHAG